MNIELISGYLLHLASAFALVGVFVFIYLRVTPFDEITLIRKGCVAPALSFGGTLIGFSWTVASGLLHLPGYAAFLSWVAAAMLIQLVAFLILKSALPDMKAALESNNVAMGALMGSISLSIGLINGACLS
jgi:putative membrane protein